MGLFLLCCDYISCICTLCTAVIDVDSYWTHLIGGHSNKQPTCEWFNTQSNHLYVNAVSSLMNVYTRYNKKWHVSCYILLAVLCISLDGAVEISVSVSRRLSRSALIKSGLNCECLPDPPRRTNTHWSKVSDRAPNKRRIQSLVFFVSISSKTITKWFWWTRNNIV